MDSLKALIREVPDFPKPGINFYDITTLLKDSAGFKTVIDSLAEEYRSVPIDVILGIEARGLGGTTGPSAASTSRVQAWKHTASKQMRSDVVDMVNLFDVKCEGAAKMCETFGRFEIGSGGHFLNIPC